MHPQLQPLSAPVDTFRDLPAPIVPSADHALLHEILEAAQYPNLMAVVHATTVRRSAPALPWPNTDVRARLDAVRASLIPRRLPVQSVAPVAVTYADVFAELAQSTRRRVVCSVCLEWDCTYSRWVE
jgi:hypothetical protein